MPMVTQPAVVVGVDTHARTHTFAMLNPVTGELVDTRSFPTTRSGLDRAVSWIQRTAGQDAVVAVEGTGSYGAPLTRTLLRTGMRVAEMDAPTKRHRKAGKSDELDAVDIARRALAEPDRLAHPRRLEGARSALQVLLTARAAMTRARTQAVNQLTALLRTHELGLDARRALSVSQVKSVRTWRARPSDELATAIARTEAKRLAVEIGLRDQQLAENEQSLHDLVLQTASTLLDQPGIGAVTAAQLIASYSHHGRVRSEAAFARLAGAAPIPASSGNTTHHRLHRGGDRALNNALWRIAFWRYHHDPNTLPYRERRLADGKTPREIIRTLKRYLARTLYRQLNTTMT